MCIWLFNIVRYSEYEFTAANICTLIKIHTNWLQLQTPYMLLLFQTCPLWSIIDFVSNIILIKKFFFTVQELFWYTHKLRMNSNMELIITLMTQFFLEYLVIYTLCMLNRSCCFHKFNLFNCTCILSFPWSYVLYCDWLQLSKIQFCKLTLFF